MTESFKNLNERYNAIINEVSRIAGERGTQDALALIGLRRELSVVVSDMQRSIAQFQKDAPDDRELSALLEEHRGMFAAERTAVANSQAKWAATEMQRDRVGYEESVRATKSLHERNHRWRSDILIPAIARLKR